MMTEKYVIGVDYGTDSCRALVVDASTGKELATSVQYYPRWKEELYCDAQSNQYRQHPLDYIETLIASINEAMSNLPASARDKVVGISFDMTSCTPCLTDKEGVPLALLDEFKDNPNAMFVLWKDHTAIAEAERINQLARKWDIDYTQYSGGIYSSEWVWAKVVHILEQDESVRAKAYSWIEHIDWIPALLTGKTQPNEVMRSRCSAGHKAMWHESWGGLPSDDFLSTLSPYLKGFRDRLYNETYTCDTKVGNLSAEWASKLGLTSNVKVGIAAIDCHMGAVGAEVKAGTFVKVIGTSTCDIMSVPYDEIGEKLIPGICGQVDGSVIPEMIGLEAGQSAFGDLYAWYKDLLAWSSETIIAQSDLLNAETKEAMMAEIDKKILVELTKEAEKIPIEESSLLATDWMNGRRTPDADQTLKGSITGITLGTTAPMVFRALVEATAYGSRAIVERFIENGIHIDEVVGIGGISLKSPFVMQVLADVLGMPIKVAQSEQTCALGAAMYAAVIAKAYPNITDAQKAMGQGFIKTYYPDSKNEEIYNKLYEKYKRMQ